MKDSIFIKNGVIYYGKVEGNQDQLDAQENLNSLSQIRGNKLKTIQLNKQKHRISITYNKNDESIIELSDTYDMSTIQSDILSSFPNANVLPDDKAKLYIIKKPLIAILILISIILIISLISPNSNTGNGAKLNTEALMGLLEGFASLGMPKVILIFGSLMIIPITSIVLKLKNYGGNTIIQF